MLTHTEALQRKALKPLLSDVPGQIIFQNRCQKEGEEQISASKKTAKSKGPHTQIPHSECVRQRRTRGESILFSFSEMTKPQMMAVHPIPPAMTDTSHPHSVLTRLSEQRSLGLFCDVTIVVEDVKFRAHRNVLAATSGYFRNAFTASETCTSSQVLELPDLKSEVFGSILNYIYTSTVESASPEDNKSLVAAGKRLGIPFLEKLFDAERQESKLFHNQATDNLQCLSSQPKSGPCTLKKETPRPEDQDCLKGPRITNAFSITEVAAGNDPFTPMDMHINDHQSPNTEPHQSDSSPQDVPTGESVSPNATSETTHALSEHSYAVSQGHQSANLKEGAQTCDKGDIRSTVTPPKTLINHRLGPIKKRHRPCKGTTPSNDTSTSILDDVSNPVVQNSIPDPSPLPESSDSLCVVPNLLPPPDVTPLNDADPPPLTPVDIDSAKTYHCEQCPEVFNNLALLTIHTQVHKRRFVSHLFCKHCHKKFMHLKRLRNHEQVCVKGPPALERNDKEDDNSLDANKIPGMEETPDFQDPPVLDPLLTRPVETPLDGFTKPSSGHRAYKCSVCKRAYVTLSSLKRHENVHSWQRAYPCHYCNKVFALAEYRTKHEIWHTGERRYQCIFCLETFMTYYILKNHQKSFHGIDPRLAVNKKSANGGFKGSVYPIKLYRLLPMKFRKKRYKSYSQTYPEVTDNLDQSFTAPLDINLPAVPPEDGVSTENTDSVVSGQSLFSLPVTFMATPKMVASEMPRIIFDQPSDQNGELSLLSDTRGSGLLLTSNTHKKAGLPCFEGTGSPVFSYGYTTSVTSQDDLPSNLTMHGNDPLPSQNDTNKDNLPFLNIPPVCSFEGLSKLSELSAAAHTIEAMANQLLQPRPESLMQNLSPSGKTETYIAKPACPGPSINNKVLPLCQITVKIGNEAVIRRKIKGSKLFPKKKKRRSWRQVEDESNSTEDGLECPSLRLRTEVTTSAMQNEPYDDVNDPENDKLWRPYYTYKPKRKRKKLKSGQKRMKAVQYYTRPLSPEPDNDVGLEESVPLVSSSGSCESKRQLRSHSPRETFPCRSCSCTFSTPTSLSMHMISCHHPRCKLCGKQCPLEQSNADVPFTEESGEFICQSCKDDGSCFSSDVAARSLNCEKRYRCSYCPQRFLYLATKKSHEAKHLEKFSKGRACRYCPKICKSAALLSIHESKHLTKAGVGSDPESTETKANSGSYSSVSEIKEQPKLEPWESSKICSPQAPKEEEPVKMGSFYPSAPQIHKKPFLSKGDRHFSPLFPEMQRKKSKKKSLLEHSKDFGLEGHRRDSVGAETQGQKGHLPNTLTNNHLSSTPYPAYLTRLPVTKGVCLQSAKSEWRLCKEEPLFHTHN